MGGTSADAPAVKAQAADTPKAVVPEITYTSFEGIMAEQCAEISEKLLALSIVCGWNHYDLTKWQSLLACGSEIFIALREDGSIGGCALRTSYAVADDESRGFGMLGMMLVDPALRGCGVAGRLLAAFQERVEGLGQTCGMGCATPAGLPVYLKKGYKPVTPDASCIRVSAPCSAVTLSSSEDDIDVTVFKDASIDVGLKHLLSLDREVSGLDRTKQLCKLAEAQGAFVAIASRGGQTIGALICVADSQTGTWNIGPILGTEAAATKLITAVAHKLPAGSLAFFVYNHCEYVERLVTGGFTSAPAPMTGTMVLGDVHMPGDRSQYIAMISPALG